MKVYPECIMENSNCACCSCTNYGKDCRNRTLLMDAGKNFVAKDVGWLIFLIVRFMDLGWEICDHGKTHIVMRKGDEKETIVLRVSN